MQMAQMIVPFYVLLETKCILPIGRAYNDEELFFSALSTSFRCKDSGPREFPRQNPNLDISTTCIFLIRRVYD